MKKQSGSTTLTAEQRREIIGMASQVAIEQYQKAAERARRRLADCVALHIRYGYQSIVERRLNVYLTFIDLFKLSALSRYGRLFIS